MKRVTKTLLLSATALALAAVADDASAQIVINGAGSSAGRQFVGGAPLAMCLNQNGLVSPKPIKLRSSNPANLLDDTGANRITWICNVTYSIPSLGISFTNQPAIIRYSSSESGDGFTRLTGQYGTATTAPYILDTSTCTQQPDQTENGITYELWQNCSQQSLQTVNWGASDVQAGSFGQQGPTGTFFPPSGQPPLDDSAISNETVAALPFALFVSDNVRTRTGPNATDVGPAVTSLTREQIRAIVQRQVRDWADLGYGVTTDATHTTFDANSGITLCRREAGSGTVAAFWQTIANETPSLNGVANGSGGLVVYSPSSSGVVSCLTTAGTGSNNRRGIGYLNAESVVAGNHVVGISGGMPNYPTATTGSPIERKRDVACGRYLYWSDWRVTRLTAGDGGNVNNLVRVFADAARTRTNNIPSGTHWVANADMTVQKTIDAGPITWRLVAGAVPDNPQCRP
jgi:hypothetical protein